MSLTKHNIDHILQLFKKLQNLSITKKEYNELKKWASDAEENKQVWDNFHDKEKIESDRLLWQSFNSELALNKIKTTVRRRVIFRYTAAATLFIVFSFSFYFITRHYTPTLKNNIVASNEILPAGNNNHAILKFSDNQTIVLDNAQNGIKLSKNGIIYQNGDLVTEADTDPKTKWVTLSVPRGNKYELTLDDGTKIWVNAATELRFPKTFATAGSREVELQGEAYFEVAHNAKKPFKVKMDNEWIEVLGTSFSLSNYKSDETSIATLFTGKIALTLTDLSQANKTILAPGQQAVYNKREKKLDIFEVDGRKELAWKNGDFLFEKDHILTIMKQVERWYDITVIYHGDFKQSYFSGIVSRSQPLSAVLEMLAATEKLKFNVNKERKEVILTATEY